MDDKQSPAPPEILEERDRIITTIGDSEMILTKDSIRIQARERGEQSENYHSG